MKNRFLAFYLKFKETIANYEKEIVALIEV
ncbi:hypothetical protein ACUXCC_002834 [Cytobacillus horneckiae]